MLFNMLIKGFTPISLTWFFSLRQFLVPKLF